MNQQQWIRLPVIFAVFLLISAIALAATMKSIQIKKGVLRSSPSFMGKVIANVSYGDRVENMGNKNGWSKVKPVGTDTPGWIHDSALTHKKILLVSGNTNVAQSATGDEIALAGKGFNEQVEREFKKKHPRLDFSTIDMMEKNVVSDKQMRQFLNRGKVQPRGGAE